MTSAPTPLAREREVLREILDRLMAEESSLDALCKHTPRLVSVAANLARIEAALISNMETNETDALRAALRELEAAQADEEETQW